MYAVLSFSLSLSLSTTTTTTTTTRYLHQVVPGNSGHRKHPLFFLSCRSAKAIDARGPEAHSRVGNVDRSLIEDIPEEEDDEDDGEGGLGAGGGRVSLRALSKTFRSGSSGAVVALDGLTLDMLPGQIFALLGHNGAGKSTAISLLTGLSRATSGSASIFGQQISENMDEIRQDMGYCEFLVLFILLPIHARVLNTCTSVLCAQRLPR
jgi:ATP-binding cassette subfamily A (ABC1) protein 3